MADSFPHVETCDIVVIGGGPAGHKAAIQGAKADRSVVLIEQERDIGGACVHRGTIPSKTLRETALALAGFRQRTADVFAVQVREELQVASLMARMEQVVQAHAGFMAAQLERNHVVEVHGRARFLDARTVEVLGIKGTVRRFQAATIVVATGTRPRAPANVPIDHENILDSDSILSMTYLPRSLTVLGAGVIASEYASIFSNLGVNVTMIDSGDRPLAFLDPEITTRFVTEFERGGARFMGNERIERVAFDGTSMVETVLQSGTIVRSEKLLCALGRVANVEHLAPEAAGIQLTPRGVIAVNEHWQTSTPGIYAVGDVIGPPALASTSMEQGRRAVCHALGIAIPAPFHTIPIGVYTVPEIASVGQSEAEVNQALTPNQGHCLVGRAHFHEIARGQISAIQNGMLKMVADPTGQHVLGVQIISEEAAELIHIGQVALLTGFNVDAFIDNPFNFPTLAEAYRVAALDIAKQRPR